MSSSIGTDTHGDFQVTRCGHRAAIIRVSTNSLSSLMTAETLDRVSPRTILIGGSAGALASLQELFKALPGKCGAAIVVIQHRSPEHTSQLDTLIAKWTEMPVHQAVDAIKIQADHVYVTLPGQFMAMKDDTFHLVDPDVGTDPYRPIDFFCQSLAAEYGSRAALVVLSGTGHDGTVGAGEVKKANGAVLVQDPLSATFDSMPTSVLEAGFADLALPPDEIAVSLCAWGQSGQLGQVDGVANTDPSGNEALPAILDLVREHAKRDMGGYKSATLCRRIERRMGLRHVPTMEAYLLALRQDSDELDQLSRDLLIGVTTFFRDAEAFEIIQQTVVPQLCGPAKEHASVRVWIAGCSTGEEVYSIAILLMEWFAARDQGPRIKIFATDVDDKALEVARNGFYSKDSLAGVSSDRIAQFFTPERGGYRVAKSLREHIVFASHNLISDPPFSKLDLVVCRNVLIYLTSATQKKVLSLFHFVLNDGGYLFLGSSENLGSVDRHFEATSKKWRIYCRLATPPRRPPSLPLAGNRAMHPLFKPAGALSGTEPTAGQERQYQQVLADFGPTQVLVNSNFEVLFVSGNTDSYLGVPIGQASHDLLKMAKPALAMALRSAINGAQRSRTRTAASAVISELEDPTGQQGVRIEVVPVPAADHETLFLVCFSPEVVNRPVSSEADVSQGAWDWRQLEHELSATQEDLQRTIDQARMSSLEMSASNEEIMAMNEELQTANEELESSKEELQSLNDELVTSNASLDVKVIEADSLNADLNNLLNSAETATMLLDEALCIRRFTPTCVELMRLAPGDIGRGMEDVVRLFNDPGLSDACRAVLRGERIAQKEIHSEKGQWFLRRVLPYRNATGGIDGVVLTFPDITTIKQADQLLLERASALQWQSDLLSRAAPIVARDMQDRIIYWNKGAEDLYGWSDQEVLGRVSHEVLRTEFPIALAQIKVALAANGHWHGELAHVKRDGTNVTVESQWSIYADEAGMPEAIVEVNTNITKRKQAQAALRDSDVMFHTMLDSTVNWEYWVDLDGKFIYMTPSVETITGYRSDEFVHNPNLLDAIVYPEDAYLWDRIKQKSRSPTDDDAIELKLRIVRKNGSVLWIEHAGRPVTDKNGMYSGRRVTVRDISAEKDAEEQIRNLAYFDPLTQLPNRRLLMDRLNQALIVSKRTSQYGALMILDMDQFKSLNDTQGHDVGDGLLVEVAKRLTANVRQQDTVSRFGGDEFVVILDGLGLTEQGAANEAQSIAEKIRELLSRPYFLGDAKAKYQSTSSAGLTLFHGMETSAAVLLKQADLALYQAKDDGRNLVRYFSPGMQAAINARTALEVALRKGLDNQEFQLYYQPQVDQDGRIIGAEALIRWFSPDQGMVSPADFIPLAEDTGLIIPMGQWIVKTACDQLKEWEADPRSADLLLSVNVSVRQFQHPEFVSQVRNALIASGANPKRLKLELTESVVLNKVELVIARMHELIELGVSFSLDDFGTGYSSLSYLKLLPLDQVKIDQSFIRDVIVDPNDAAIVRAILAISQAMGVQVVAEGVETPEQRDFLLSNGCKAYQGYLFGKPVPIADWH
jgi:two-component system, chemotaxis family, CheB/CheR fusion protein